MYRKIFPSYDWDDVWYVNQIVNLSEVTSITAAGFIKNVPNEEVKSSDAAIKRWIDDNMNGCSCLVLFWGEKTYESRWVKYELEQADARGMGMLAIDISGMRGPRGVAGHGPNPLFVHGIDRLGHHVESYRWVDIFMPQRLIGIWIENACRYAKR